MSEIKTTKQKYKKYNLAIAAAIAIFFIADRFLKIAALQSADKESLHLIKGLLDFRLTANYGAAFSLPLNGFWFTLTLALVIIALMIAVLYFWKKEDRWPETVALSAILAGALSNYFDRLKYGYVIDYFHLTNFSVFNLADVLISGGALFLIIKNLRK